MSEPEKIAQASRAFEAVLLRQILSETQKPVFPSKLIGNSTADGIYRDEVVNQLADSISKSGSFGLGRQLASELQRQYHVANPSGTETSAASAQSGAAKGGHPTPTGLHDFRSAGISSAKRPLIPPGQQKAHHPISGASRFKSYE